MFQINETNVTNKRSKQKHFVWKNLCRKKIVRYFAANIWKTWFWEMSQSVRL